jgi:hypothetical protein
MPVQRKPALARVPVADDALAGMADTPTVTQASAPRPRTRSPQVVFSSKMAVDVREALDQHVADTGETISGLLDRLLRTEFNLPPAPRR